MYGATVVLVHNSPVKAVELVRAKETCEQAFEFAELYKNAGKEFARFLYHHASSGFWDGLCAEVYRIQEGR